MDYERLKDTVSNVADVVREVSDAFTKLEVLADKFEDVAYQIIEQVEDAVETEKRHEDFTKGPVVEELPKWLQYTFNTEDQLGFLAGQESNLLTKEFYLHALSMNQAGALDEAGREIIERLYEELRLSLVDEWKTRRQTDK